MAGHDDHAALLADDEHAGDDHDAHDDDHGHGAHDHGHGHDDHGADKGGWVLIPVAVGLVIGIILAVLLGLGNTAVSLTNVIF